MGANIRRTLREVIGRGEGQIASSGRRLHRELIKTKIEHTWGGAADEAEMRLEQRTCRRTEGGEGRAEEGGGRGSALDYKIGIGGSVVVGGGKALAADLGDGERPGERALHRPCCGGGRKRRRRSFVSACFGALLQLRLPGGARPGAVAGSGMKIDDLVCAHPRQPTRSGAEETHIKVILASSASKA